MLLQSFNFSINLMTLLALILAIGLVVDDAIVVLENVDRHIKEGKRHSERRLLVRVKLQYPLFL